MEKVKAFLKNEWVVSSITTFFAGVVLEMGIALQQASSTGEALSYATIFSVLLAGLRGGIRLAVRSVLK